VEPVNENAVFEAVRALAADGEYLDDIPGIPVAEASRGGGWYRPAGHMVRRIYRRGSPEHLQARSAGLVDRLPGLVPAPAAAVEEAESIIGYRLPPLLRRLYLGVGNGGFGPGYGILGLRGGHGEDTGRTALDLYRQAHDTPSAAWSFLPEGLLPVCHWGCGIYSFADCSQPEGQMWGWDPNPGPVDRQALYREQVALAGWLSRWLIGTLYQPALVQDPVTQQWRGATDEEYAQWIAELDEPNG
jgi:hypothetical protein